MSETIASDKLIQFLKEEGFEETEVTKDEQKELDEITERAVNAQREDLEASYISSVFNWGTVIDERDKLQAQDARWQAAVKAFCILWNETRRDPDSNELLERFQLAEYAMREGSLEALEKTFDNRKETP